MVGGGGEKTNVTGKDLAAALAPERGRAPVLNKEVAALKERYRKDQGKSVFEADMAQNEGDLMVNFDEMRRVLDSEQKRVDAEKDPKKKDVLQKRHDRLALRYNVYDKLLNNEGISAMDTAEQRELINAMAALPGFAEAASVAIGGRLSTEQMMKVLSGKGGVAITPDEKKALSEVVASMANDDRFKNRVSKSLAGLKMGDDDAKISKDIDDLKYKIREKDEVQKKLDDAKKIKSDYEVAHPTKEIRDQISAMYTDVHDLATGLDTQYKPKSYTDSELSGIKTRLTTLVATRHAAAVAGAGGPQALQLSDAEQRATDQLDTFNQIEILAKGNSATIKEYEKYNASTETITESEKTLREYSKDEKEIVSKEAERGKYADIYKRKMEVALSEEMKRYWNEVSLENASKAADARAAIKGEEDQAVKDLAEKRVHIAGDMLERFTQMSYLKYEKGEAKGWDDQAIKDFAKKEIFSRSPKQLSRDMLDRIIRNRGTLPRAYGKEIDALLKEMGVGAGNPPATTRDILNSIDASEYQKWAAAKIPDMLGYAQARGYYFDRMRIKPAQAEFLVRAYDEKFFEDAVAAKGKYADQAAALMGGEFMDGGALNIKKIREAVLGKDWTQGTKKLMKYLAIAGAGYMLGGGLVVPAGLHPGAPFMVDFAAGAHNVAANATKVGQAALNTAGLVSRLSTKGVSGAAGAVATATNTFLNP